jgi:signal transduction histidine kinase
MSRPNTEQKVALYGIAVFYMAAISDILLYNNMFGHQHPKTPVSEASMLFFVISQTLSLFIANNRIISESLEAKQILVSEKENLEKINRMKTEFLGNVSHELKTPLTVMSGYAQTTKNLAEQPGELDRKELSRRMKLIFSEAERLSLMVGQILDVTRMEENSMSMNPITCYVDEIVHKAIETHYSMLDKNSNRLEIHVEDTLPQVIADPERISQVIVNLVSNSVRFTTNGLISISIEHVDKNILVRVTDSGTGISTEQLPHIFQRYNSKGNKSSKHNTGTGLGLYICKTIIEQHQGKIWISSDIGIGTTVSFTLPVY